MHLSFHSRARTNRRSTPKSDFAGKLFLTFLITSSKTNINELPTFTLT